jgi:transposase-like protein
MENKKFDYEAFKKEAAERLKKGGSMLGKDGVFTPLFKDFLEEAPEGELDAHLAEDPEPNRNNGKGKSVSKRPMARSRSILRGTGKGSFELELLPKRQKSQFWGN